MYVFAKNRSCFRHNFIILLFFYVNWGLQDLQNRWYLRCLLGLRKLRSSKKAEIVKLFLFCQLDHEKKFFLTWRKETAFFLLFSLWNYLLLRWAIWMRIQLFSNIKGARFEFYKKQQLILEAAVERCSGSKLSGKQLYFTSVFEDIGNIFKTCSKKFTKILKVGKVFRCL